MTRTPIPWPSWFEAALRAAQARGNELAVFESESECSGARLQFYKYLAELRGNEKAELHSAARTCTVQWLKAPNTQSKRVLRFVVDAARTNNPLAKSSDREEIEQELEKEKILAEMRAQFRSKK